MATVFIDGFDYYVSGDIPKRWTNIADSANTLVGPGYSRPPGGQGLRANTSSNSATGAVYKTFGSNYVQGVLGFAFYSPGTSLASRVLAMIFDGTSEQISIRTDASSRLTVTRGGTVLGTGTTTLNTLTWHYIELKFLINNSTGYYGLQLNGVTEIATSASNQNTRSTSNNYWNGVSLGHTTSNAPFQYDDVYVLDTSTGTNTDYLGAVRVAVVQPVSPGNYAQWTPNGGANVGAVSEPYQDGDGSFNQSSTANQIDTFAFSDLPASSGSVFALQHVLVARQDAGAARTIAALQRSSSTDYVGTTQSLSSSYQFLTEIKDQDPAAGPGSWTVSNVNAAEFGYKLIS